VKEPSSGEALSENSTRTASPLATTIGAFTSKETFSSADATVAPNTVSKVSIHV